MTLKLTAYIEALCRDRCTNPNCGGIEYEGNQPFAVAMGDVPSCVYRCKIGIGVCVRNAEERSLILRVPYADDIVSHLLSCIPQPRHYWELI